jgi:hypothetical protein
MSPPETPPTTRKKRRSARRSPPRPRPKATRAEVQRAYHPLTVTLFSPASLPGLPIPLRDEGVFAPCPKGRFRSWYRPFSSQACRRYWAARKAHPPEAAEAHFEAVFYLLDFSPLRPRLAHLTLIFSAAGEPPFDPLSLLLACWVKIALGIAWTTLADRLAAPGTGALWRRRCGFRRGATPDEATLRAFRDRLPQETFNTCHRLFLATLQRLGVLPDPTATHGYIVVGDGQRHRAHSQHRCHHAVASCYEEHSAAAPRPCPAQEKSAGRYFCACDTEDCRARCGLAPRLDREASYSVYSYREASGTPPPGDDGEEHDGPSPDGRDGLWGYRSIAARLVDPRLHLAWNVRTEVLTATADEGTFFPQHLAGTCANLPTPAIGFVIYDSACGEQPCLDAVYDRGGIPLFALTHRAADDDAQAQKRRGYDGRGWPLCHQGFPMTWQGLDRHHRPPRARWVCLHACRKSEAGAVADCAYLDSARGQHTYLYRALPDGNYRLARLVPPGSRYWKRLLGWRNMAEGRNSALQRNGLKQLPDYGLDHVAFLIGWADVIENLCTLARLVLEATLLDERVQPREAAARPPFLRVAQGLLVENLSQENAEEPGPEAGPPN